MPSRPCSLNLDRVPLRRSVICPAHSLPFFTPSSLLHFCTIFGLWAAEQWAEWHRAPKRLEGGGELSWGWCFVFFCLSSLVPFSIIIFLFITPLHMDFITTRGEKEHVDVWRRWDSTGNLQGGGWTCLFFSLFDCVLNPDYVYVTKLVGTVKRKIEPTVKKKKKKKNLT
jgi:hypothetical protein